MKSGFLIQEPFLTGESFLRPVTLSSHFLPQKPFKPTQFHSCVKPLVTFELRGKKPESKVKLSKTSSYPITDPLPAPQDSTLETNMLAKIEQQLQQLRQSAVDVETEIQSVTKLIEVEEEEQACLRQQQQQIHLKLKQMQYRLEERRQEYQSLLSCTGQDSEEDLANLQQEVGQLRKHCEQLRDKKRCLESSNVEWRERKRNIMAKLCQTESQIIRLSQNRDRHVRVIEAKIKEEQRLQEQHHKLQSVLSNLYEFGCEQIPQQIAQIRHNKSLISVEVDCQTQREESYTEQVLEEQKRELLVLERDCHLLEASRVEKKQLQRKLKKLVEQKAKKNGQATREINEAEKMTLCEQAKEQSIREEVHGLRDRLDKIELMARPQFKQEISSESGDYYELEHQLCEQSEQAKFWDNNAKEQTNPSFMKIVNPFVVGLCVAGALWLPWCWL